MKKSVHFSLHFILGAVVTAIMTVATHAGQIYIYKDREGGTLLTNRKSSDRSLTKLKPRIIQTVIFILIATGATLKPPFYQAIVKIRMHLIKLFVRRLNSMVFLKV